MQREYVEKRDEGYYLAGSRVSLASIIYEYRYEYREGAAPETIQRNFPTLSQEQVHGAIAFYLGHREEAEAYPTELERKWDQLERHATPVDPELQRRLEDVRILFQADADMKHANHVRDAPSGTVAIY